MKTIILDYGSETLRIEYTISDYENGELDIEDISDKNDLDVYEFYETKLSELQEAIFEKLEEEDRELKIENEVAKRGL